MASIRKIARAVGQGFKTFRLDPSGDLMREANRRRPSSTTVAEKRVRSAAAKSFQASTTAHYNSRG